MCIRDRDQGDALGVGGDCKGDCVILVALAHCDGGHNQNFVRVYEASLMGLCTGDVNALGGTLNDMKEQIGISLLGGSQTAEMCLRDRQNKCTRSLETLLFVSIKVTAGNCRCQDGLERAGEPPFTSL